MALAISGVTGTISNGQSVTITGTDFGATGPTVVLFDDFEKGTNGNAVSTSANGAQVGSWGEKAGADYIPTYSTTEKHGGSNAMRLNFTTQTVGIKVDFSDTDRVYFSFWTYCPSTSQIPGTGETDGPNYKLVLVADDVDGEGTYGSDFTYVVEGSDLPLGETQTPGWSAWYDSSGLYTGQWINTEWNKGEWHRFEGYLYGHTSSGTAYLWETNASHARLLIDNASGVATKHAADMWNHFSFPGYARADAQGIHYHDDVYIATGTGALARVEIGNNATYANCTNLAVCTPTSWSDTSIAVTLRAGSFTTGTAYLFVVDANGNASGGYEVTLGNTYGSAKIFGISTGSLAKIDGVAISSINKIFGYDF